MADIASGKITVITFVVRTEVLGLLWGLQSSLVTRNEFDCGRSSGHHM